MKERPILFSGPMVRALLDGRKTQTRRIVKHPDHYGCPTGDCPHSTQWECDQAMNSPEILADCPFGRKGGHLWVREAWCQKFGDDDMPVYNADGYLDSSCCWYRATNPDVIISPGLELPPTRDGRERSPWRPSIHMPRWASRITLEVTEVRVQRVQDISEEDAIAEGCPDYRTDPKITARFDQTWASLNNCSGGKVPAVPAIDWYRHVWESINGDGSWAMNPWVWAVTFRVLQAGGAGAARPCVGDERGGVSAQHGDEGSGR